MEIEITKGGSADRITLTRADGSTAETTFPKKGPVPHDAVHLFVERGLDLRHGFWGMVAAGRHPEELADLAKAMGHASAKRLSVPDPAIVELIQAERLVECFEAELWSAVDENADAAPLIEVARTACEASLVPLPPLTEGAVAQVRRELGAFARDWIGAPQGYVARLVWA